MVDWKTRLAQRISAAQASLEKVAGEGCSHESAKDPEALIDGAADVQVEGNLPEGVTIPGEKGMSADGSTSEDRGTDIGHVADNSVETTEGSETVKGNEQVDDIIESAKEFEKCASELIATAKQILALPDSAFSGGVVKTASAEITESDVEQFILKRASEGDPVAQGMINYCQMVYKVANAEDGVPAEAIAEGGDIEAQLAQVQEQVAGALKQEYPDLPDEVAQQIAAESTAAAVQQAMAGGEQPANEAAIAQELVGEVAAQLKQEVPDLSDEDAEALAVQAVADTLQNGGEAPAEEGVEKAASAECSCGKCEACTGKDLPKPDESDKDAIGGGAAEDAKEVKAIQKEESAEPKAVEPKAEKKNEKKDAKVEKTASDEEEKDGEEPAAAEPEAAPTEEVVEETTETPEGEVAAETEVPAGDTEEGINEDEVASQIGEVVMELAGQIKTENPEISDDEALQGAVEAVGDALQTVDAQQAIGAVDEAGAPVVSDEDAAQIVDQLGKTASANPLRDHLCDALNQRLGLSPEAFAKRLMGVR